MKSVTWGAAGDVGYRFERGRYFVEPIGSVLWSQNKTDNLNLGGAALAVDFGTANGLSFGGGARVGGVVMDDNIHYLEASVIGRVWDRVNTNNNVTIVSTSAPTAFPPFVLSDRFSGVYGEAGVQFDWINRFTGWSAYARADAKFNEEFQTYTGKLGVRYSFASWLR